MKSNRSFNVFIVLLVISAITAGLLTVVSCNQRNGGTCTFEGLECPNALAISQRDSIAYVDLEATVDILCDSITSLNVQLAGCELQDHSKLQQVFNSGALHLTRDSRGLISVIYREADGNEYALDYVTDAAFYEKFGYHASK